ncbi:MAG: hypothetical protein AB1609_12630 [Bacillota bacterium]
MTPVASAVAYAFWLPFFRVPALRFWEIQLAKLSESIEEARLQYDLLVFSRHISAWIAAVEKTPWEKRSQLSDTVPILERMDGRFEQFLAERGMYLSPQTRKAVQDFQQLIRRLLELITNPDAVTSAADGTSRAMKRDTYWNLFRGFVWEAKVAVIFLWMTGAIFGAAGLASGLGRTLYGITPAIGAIGAVSFFAFAHFQYFSKPHIWTPSYWNEPIHDHRTTSGRA